MLLVSHRLQQGLHPLDSISVYMHSREWGLLCSLTCSCSAWVITKVCYMCRVLFSWNSTPSALKRRIADMADSPLQQAWADGTLPANIREILETKQGSHHNYARVAVQTPHTSAGKVSRHLYEK